MLRFIILISCFITSAFIIIILIVKKKRKTPVQHILQTNLVRMNDINTAPNGHAPSIFPLPPTTTTNSLVQPRHKQSSHKFREFVEL